MIVNALINRLRGLPLYLLKRSIINLLSNKSDKYDGLVYYFNGADKYYDKLHERYYDNKINCFDFNGIKVPEFYDKRSFISEYLDLIYPTLNVNIHDYPYNEGPYEYGDVCLENEDIVIDCGANIGMFSAYAAEKGCSVYAFEPVPSVVTILKETAKLTEGINIKEYALSNSSGNINIKIDVNNMAGSTNIIGNKDNNSNIINVASTTLDDFTASNNINKIDFIKADIEGAERYMLLGATNVLKELAPKLAICTYHMPDDPKVIKEIILNANPKYTIIEKWKKLYAFIR